MFDKLFRRNTPEAFIQKALAIIGDAEALPAVQGLRSIDEWLSGAMDKSLQAQTGLTLLQQIDEPLRQLLKRGENALFTGFTNPTKTTLLLQTALPFARNLTHYFALGLQQEGAALARRGGNTALLQNAVAASLYWNGKLYLLQFLLAPSQTFRWDQVLALHEFAHKLEAGQLTRLTGGDSQLAQVRRQLAYLLLLTRTLARDLNGRQTLLADRIVEMLSPMVMLSEHHTAETPFGTPQENGPPTVTADRHAPPDANKRPLFFGLTRCIVELQALEHMLQQENHVPSRLDPGGEIEAAEALTVLRNLRLRWSGKQVTRKDRRINASGELQLIYEFAPIRRMISLQDKADQHKTVEPTRSKAQAENISASGMGLLLGKDADWARIGRLVGIKQPDTPRWSLGIVRRYAAREQGGFIGVQVLSTHPESVRLVEKSADSSWEKMTQHKVYSNILGLMIPAAEGQPFQLLTPGKLLMPGHSYGMAIGGAAREIRISDLQELGADFALYLAHYVAAGGNPATSPAN